MGSDHNNLSPSKRLHGSSHFSISRSVLVCLLLTPMLLISVLVCNLGPHKSLSSSFSWRYFELITTSFSLSSLSAVDESDHSRNFNSSRHGKPSIEEKVTMKHELSRAEKRGFVTSGLRRKYSQSEKIESVLARARSSIRRAYEKNEFNASSSSSHYEENPGYIPQGPIYHNANAFYRSYLLMEEVFKIYVYEEGEAPIFHNGPCRSIYSTEGRFIHEMERGNRYRTKNPDKAHVFFMPFSVVGLVQYLYEPGSNDRSAIGNTVADYISTISQRHPFWNRSLGADHFMLSCHDWAPYTTSFVPLMFSNSIRVLCNANTSEGFVPLKDATLPEANLKTGEIKGLVGGPHPSQRTLLAFFAGGLHGHIRKLLVSHWKDKDPSVRVYERVPPNVSYESMLRKSRYCLCPSGYEVASPRIVEAIYAECVPVLISDSYVPPFSDVLNWRKFSVTIKVEDIPNVKRILMGISEAKYLKMQRRVKQVQRHFLINGPPKRFDMFHMIVHSVWLRRLNLRLHSSV